MRRILQWAAVAATTAALTFGATVAAEAHSTPRDGGPNGNEVMTKSQLIKLLQSLPEPGNSRIYVLDPKEGRAFPIAPLIKISDNKRYGRWRLTISPWFAPPLTK